MPNHKLLSPTNTYTVFPTVGNLNKGSRQTQDQLQVRTLNRLMSLHEITASHNGRKLQQNRNLQSGKSAIVPSGFSMERRTEAVSTTMKPTNTNMQTWRNNPRDGDWGSTSRNATSDAAPSGFPGTSIQSGSSSESKGRRKPDTTAPKNDEFDKDYVKESDSDSSSSLDFSDIHHKKTVESLRLPYTLKEDIAILKYVLLSDNINRTGSLSLWRELEDQMVEPKRTYQSLKNRFLRNLKPHLLTKYRSLLTAETLARVKRKFPDLKGCKTLEHNGFFQEHIKSRHVPPVNSKERPVVNVNPCHGAENVVRNKPTTTTTRERENNMAPVDETNFVEDEVIPSSRQNRKASTGPIREATAREVERREGDTASGNGSAGDEASAAVELFVPGKVQNLPIQAFQCTKIIETLHDKTNLNLNIVLLNGRSSSLLSKLTGPVKLDIVVSVSSLQENRVETEKVDVFGLGEVPKAPKTVEKQRKRRRIQRRPIKSVKLKKKYFLRLGKCNYKKLLNLTPEYKQTLAGLLRRIDSTVSQKRMAAKEGRDGEHRMILRSRMREAFCQSNEDEMTLRSGAQIASPDELADSDKDEDEMIEDSQSREATPEEVTDSGKDGDGMIEDSQSREATPEGLADSEKDEDGMIEDSQTREDSPDEPVDSEDDDVQDSQTQEASPDVQPSKKNEDGGDRMILRSRTREASSEDNEDRMTLRSRTREVSPALETSKNDGDEDRMTLRSRTREASPEDNEDRSSLTQETPSVADSLSQISSQATNCSEECDSDYDEMYRQVTKRYKIVTVADDESQSSEEWDYTKKRPKMEENHTTNNILLKNMVGMLNPSSRVFSIPQSTSNTLSKKL